MANPIVNELPDYADRFERMRASSEELERFVAALPLLDDSTPLIREDRDRDS